MSDGFYLGIDGGGTGTRTVVLDANAAVIARATSGPSNYHSVGQAVAETSLHTAIHQVLAAAELTMEDVSAVGLGLAGVARSSDVEVVQTILSRIAHFPRVIITHDAEIALVGGVGRRYGVVLIVGTGAIAYGVNGQGESHRADGWGYIVGDEGSGLWIGQQSLRAVARAYDGRGPATTLEATLLAHLGLEDARALVTLVYADGFGVPQLASLAPLVSQAARIGDNVSQAILHDAGRRLSDTLSAVICGLDMTEEAFEAALVGGVLRAQGLIWKTVVASLSEIAPRATPIRPRHDAAVGAALLARQTKY